MPADIITIGEAMLELSCDKDPRVVQNFARAYGGDTLNTAVAAQRLGSKTAFVTRMAQDPFAQGLRDLLSQEGLEITGHRNGQGQTGLYIVYVNAEQQGKREFHYYRQNSAAANLGPEDIPIEAIKQAKVIFSSGITLALSESARKAVHLAFTTARANGVLTAFDPNYRPALWKSTEKALDAFNEILPLVDVILPSIPQDTMSLIGFSRPEQVVDYFGFKGVRLVAVKAGEQGCYLGYKKQIEHVPAMSVKAVDTTGAGDAFNGGFLHGLAKGYNLKDCAKLGVTTAGLKVLNRGTISALPHRDIVYNRIFG